MKQSISLFRNISLVILSSSLFLASCSKKDKVDAPGGGTGVFAGQYVVNDDDETYVLKVESKGENKFQIKEFGGFLNVPLNAVAEGSTLKIPSQTFTNPNGHTLTIVGTGYLSTKSSKDDTITFQYSVSGFTEYDSVFEGTRK